MNQSSVIAGSLLLAFVIFVIVRHELPCYLNVLGISTGAGCPLGTISATGIVGAVAGAAAGAAAGTLPQLPSLPTGGGMA